MAVIIDMRSGANPARSFNRQVETRSTDDYQLKSCILTQKGGLLTSGRSQRPSLHHPSGLNPNLDSLFLSIIAQRYTLFP